MDTERWQNIIEYYGAAISAENLADVKFRLNNDGKDFLLVRDEECISSGSNALVFDEQHPEFRSFMQGSRWSAAPINYFYGYPCRVDRRGLIHPLIVFDLEQEQTAGVQTFSIYPKRPRPNTSWLDFDVTPQARKQVIDVFNAVWDESLPVLDNVDAVLEGWETIIPSIDREDLLQNPTGVLFRSFESPFTRGLEKELAQLARESSCPNEPWQLILDRNSPPVEADFDDLLEITSLNDEQRRAIKSAFVNPLTVVTGPPGTGKSQVILNVVANALRHNETVLFGSKNHKAVDVVIDRSRDTQSVPVIFKYRNDELEFAETLLQTVELALTQNAGVIDKEVKEIEEQLSRVRREELLAKQTLDRIVKRRNRIQEIENNLESIAAELHLYPGIASNLKPYVALSFNKAFPRHIATVKLLAQSVIRLEEKLGSVANELDDDLAVNLDPYGEVVVDRSIATEIALLESLTRRIAEMEDKLSALASELPAAISANMTPYGRLELSESFSQEVETAHSLAQDFANPPWFVEAMRKVSVVGQILVRKRMLQTASALLEVMPDYCKTTPVETLSDVCTLLAVARTLQEYEHAQCKLLNASEERNRAAEALLEGLPEYCVAMPVETSDDMQKLLATARVFQRYGDNQRHLLAAKEEFSLTTQSLIESLPGYCADLPIETPGAARELATVANALHRYSVHQRELLNTVELNRREPRLEVLRARIENSNGRAVEISVKLVDSLMRRRLTRLAAGERRAIVDYVQHLRALRNSYSGSDLKKEIRHASERAFRNGVARAFPAIAVTNLSVSGAIPLRSESVGLVVIDEASQCDIASALPMLYRGKRALVIGDPNQLAHIANLHRNDDARLLEIAGLTAVDDQRFSYCFNSLYDLARTTVGSSSHFVHLVEHYRSKSEIIEFSNQEFYGNVLEVHTDYRRLHPGEMANSVSWHNVAGDTVRPPNGSAYNDLEANEVVAVLQQTIENAGRQGQFPSLGIVTPFRAQANRIRTLAERRVRADQLRDLEFAVDTAHGYQGDEKDMMIFSPVLSRNAPESTVRFLGSTSNLFNVAITRARAKLHVVGDRVACADSGIPYLSRFVRYVEGIDSVQSEDDATGSFESPWEKVFFNALSEAGINSIPQYRFDQYKLDLAIPDAMIDIEIDGAYWHRSLDGKRVFSDLKRDTHLYSRGWNIKRFWVYELQSDLDRCVHEIEKAISTFQAEMK